MARERLCKVCRCWHDLDQPWPSECYGHTDRAASELPSPMIISDHMNPVQSQLDGKMYDSKSALRATYKAAGVVEVGNDSSFTTDPKPYKPPKPNRNEIEKSVAKAVQQMDI